MLAQYLDIPSKTETGHRVHMAEGIDGDDPSSLHLHLLEAVLPRNNIRRNTILAIVEQDDPEMVSHARCLKEVKIVLTCRRGSSTRRCRTPSP